MASQSWKKDLALLTSSGAVLLAYNLGGRALWSPSEGRYAELAREVVDTGDYITLHLAGIKFLEKPPLFVWLETIAIRLFGIHEWALRLWPALLALVGCVAVYAAARQIYGRPVGLIAAALLASSGLWFAFAHIISLDMAVSVWLTLALFAFLLGTRQLGGYKRRIAMWAFFLFCALAVLTKGLIGAVIPGLIIAAWIALLGEWQILRTMHLGSGIFLFLLIAAPWHLLAAHRTQGDIVSCYLGGGDFPVLFRISVSGHTLYLAHVAAAGCFDRTLPRAALRRQKPAGCSISNLADICRAGGDGFGELGRAAALLGAIFKLADPRSTQRRGKNRFRRSKKSTPSLRSCGSTKNSRPGL